MSRERKAVIVKFPLPEFLAIEAARGETDRSTWIRDRLRESLIRDRPLFAHTEAEALQLAALRPLQEAGRITRW